MKNTINIFSNNKINFFLKNLLSDYELIFISFDKVSNIEYKTQANIVIINDYNELELVDFKNLDENYLIISSLKNNKLKFRNIKLVNTPLSVNNVIYTIENFLQNIKIQFHEIFIDSEKITNLKNNSFCYLTKIELEILKHLVREKETSKNFIKKNILNLKSNIETNSLESHLTRIRKKMNKIKTNVKINTKSEKLTITI